MTPGPNPIPLGASPVFVSRPDSKGVPVVRSFDFTGLTANLNNGVAIYTPAPGEILLNQWWTVSDIFGAPAIGDFGMSTLAPGGVGFYGEVGPQADMTTMGSVLIADTLSANISYQDSSTVGLMEGIVSTQAGANPVGLQPTPGVMVASGSFLPITFGPSAGSIIFWVSEDGTLGGPAVGGGGEATISIETVIPITETLT